MVKTSNGRIKWITNDLQRRNLRSLAYVILLYLRRTDCHQTETLKVVDSATFLIQRCSAAIYAIGWHSTAVCVYKLSCYDHVSHLQQKLVRCTLDGLHAHQSCLFLKILLITRAPPSQKTDPIKRSLVAKADGEPGYSRKPLGSFRQ